MVIRSGYVSLLVLSVTSLTAFCAQAADIPLRGPIPFEMLDKNGNRMISPQEFVEVHNQRRKMQLDANLPMGRMPNEPSFIFFDKNGDNRISPEELNAARGTMREQRGGMRPVIPPPQGQGRGQRTGQGTGQGGMQQGSQMPGFADFDLNKDNVLTRDEFYEARSRRMRQRAELGYPMQNAANAPPFEVVDTNRDGRVTPDEFSAHQTQHRQMRRGQ